MKIRKGSHKSLDETRGKMGIHPPLNIIIAGGGTGGHLFPGIAIAQEFCARNVENSVLFVSRGNVFEKSALANAGFRLECISVEGIKRRGIRDQIKSILKIPKGLFESIKILKKYKPDIVVGVGSYSAGPVAAAGWLLGKKIVLHEQNILPGITNRLLSHVADRIYTSFEKAGTGLKSEKVRFTGNPVRKEFLENSLNNHRIRCPEPKNLKKPFTVVVAGGSQGAHAINMVTIGALEYLEDKERFYFIHQTGESDEKVVADAYLRHNITNRVKPFFNDMSNQYRKADIIICRSGATTVAEVTAMGKGVIFIPFPKAADNHQVLNARWLADAGAVELILEKDISPRLLARRLKYYSSNPGTLELMMSKSKNFGKPGAAKEIVDDCYNLLGA